MENPWLSSARASALPPALLTTGDLPPPVPDPPDPPLTSSSFPLSHYPPLFSSTSKLVSEKSPSVISSTSEKLASVVKFPASSTRNNGSKSSAAPLRAGMEKIQNPKSKTTAHQQYVVIQPKNSSPIQTNKASNFSTSTYRPPPPPISSNTSLASKNNLDHTGTSLNSALNPPTDDVPLSSPKTSAQDPPILSSQVLPSSQPHLPPVNPAEPPPSLHPPSSANRVPAKNLVERIRIAEDKSLHKLATPTISETGRPRVLIPDEVFQKGAEIHKDFIVCYFNGRPPPFKQIQNVLDHMWGKGKRVEIHNNPLTRSLLVRIPSDYLRQKILEKCIWYVGDSMFHTAQWTSAHSISSPPLHSIPIWAHLHGIPLDLRHQEGLSLVAGLVGYPKETDDFTKNLVSLVTSHAKVVVDLTKPLPPVVEFVRQSGEVVEVTVTYPWLPPTCSHCKELGHISKNCLLLPLPSLNKQPVKEPLATPSKSKPKGPTTKRSTTNEVPSNAAHPNTDLSSSDPQDEVSLPSEPMQEDVNPVLPPSPFSPPILPPTSPLPLPADPSFKTPIPHPNIASPVPTAPHAFGLTADCPKPSLKRSRSHPNINLSPSPERNHPFSTIDSASNQTSFLPPINPISLPSNPSPIPVTSTSNSFAILDTAVSLPVGEASSSS